MDLAPADQRHQRVADLLQPQAPLDDLAVVARPSRSRSRSRGSRARAACRRAARGSRSTRRSRAAGAARGSARRPRRRSASSIAVHGAHLVGDRADAADARGDVRRLGVARGRAGTPRRSAAARRCAAATSLDARRRRSATCMRALALDAGEARRRRDRAPSRAHGASLSSRNGSAPGVEGAVDAHEVALARPRARHPRAQRRGVRRLHRPEAAVAAAVVGRAERAAAGVGDRPEARRAVRDHHADVAAPLALDADAVRAASRGRAPVEEGADHLEQLALVDRAAAQLEVDRHVRGDRRRGRERRDVLGPRVDDRDELVDVGEVAQRLDAARGRAGADRDQRARLRAAPRWMRSASCGVVIEPSTSERSYGPVDHRARRPRGSRRSRPRRRARAARPRSRAA